MEKVKSELLRVLEEVLRGYGFSPVITWTLRFFLRNPYESTVIVNKEGNLEFMDRGSEKLFDLPEGGGKGVKITEFVPDSALPEALKTGIPSIGRVFNVKGIRRIGSTYPLIRNGEIIGSIGRLIFRSFEEVERINREMDRLKREVKSFHKTQKQQWSALYTFESILGTSEAIRDTKEMAKKVATTDVDVLIKGESGTGKELFAHAIHNFANRDKPFVRVNSAALPFDLVESELFGYVKGAFSGASTAGKPGKFELAHNGTIFLDDIDSLPLSIQAKLLRVLQEKEVERLGSTGVKKVHFRLVATTNQDVSKMVTQGKFREDLYYRIAKVTLHIPPLRERKDDISAYVDSFLNTINARFDTHFKGLSNEAFDCFLRYHWPGNVREVINVLEQACLKKWDGEEIPMSCLPSEVICSSSLCGRALSKGFKEEVKETERELILQALEKTGGNKRRAAFLLGMPRSTLYEKLKEHRVNYHP